MLRRLVLIMFLSATILSANNFRNGMLAYRNGNYTKAKVLFEMALEKDKTYNASHMLGKMYLNGYGVRVNLNKAIKYFQLAHKYGNITAGCYASQTYMKKGIFNWGLLEDGLARGLKKNVKFCYKVVDEWQNK